MCLYSGLLLILHRWPLDAGYDFDFEPSSEEAIFTVQTSVIEMAVVNLIRNAIDHAGGKGAIVIKVGASGIIDVCDEGPGIPLSEREHVFEPFRRINTHSSGAGLGLNLVQKAAEIHGGKVVFFDLKPGFCVRLQISLSRGKIRHASKQETALSGLCLNA